MAKAIDRPHRDAALVLRRLHPVVLAARSGAVLDRAAAGDTIVRSLASFQRGRVALPVRVGCAEGARRRPDARSRRRCGPRLARPVRMRARRRLAGGSRVRQLAAILRAARTAARRRCAVGGPGADRYFARLGRGSTSPRATPPSACSRAAASSSFPRSPAASSPPAATGRHILAAALAPQARTARVVVSYAQPHRSTAQAKAMGITDRVGRLRDDLRRRPEPDPQRPARRAPDRRQADRARRDLLVQPGDRRAHGRQGLPRGAGDHQRRAHDRASAAASARSRRRSSTPPTRPGLKITERTNHALYISHYPQGRDATVNYPDVDLKFVNDTPHWLLLRTYVGSSSLTSSSTARRSTATSRARPRPLVTTGPAPVEKTPIRRSSSARPPSRRAARPPQATSVERKVYTPAGKLLYDNTWYSSLPRRAELVHVGTKPRPEPPMKKGPTGPSGATGPTGVTRSAELISSASQSGTRVGR